MDALRKDGKAEILPFMEEDKALFPEKSRPIFVEEVYKTPFGAEIIPSDITADDVTNAVKSLNTSSAAGKCGLSFDHIKYVARKSNFAEKFACFCNMMLKNPELVKQLTALYTVRIIFLKKPDGSKRPI